MLSGLHFAFIPSVLVWDSSKCMFAESRACESISGWVTEVTAEQLTPLCSHRDGEEQQ